MTDKPRFTLKTILVCIAALCVPLAMFCAMGGGLALALALALVPIVLGACIGYLVKGRDGAIAGLLVGFLCGALLAAFLVYSALQSYGH